MKEPGLNPYALLKRFARDTRGVASVVGALVAILGLSLSALTLDVGHLYLAKRQLQGAVDAAALAAAGDPVNANAIAARVLAANGYTQPATVIAGAYTADTSIPIANRLDTGSSAQRNAVRVTQTIAVTSILAPFLGANGSSNIAATATASQIPVASFAIGTGLATLQNGQLNALLGGLLGTTLSLSLVNYQGLASTNVDALTFLNQLAAQVGVTAGTYGDLANANVTMAQLATAIRTALNIHPNGNDSAALDALNLISLQTPAAASALVSKIVDTALWQSRHIGSIVQQVPGQITLNVFDLVSAMARAYGPGHIANLSAGVGTIITTKLAVGSPMASVALARVGTTASTAQARLALGISLTTPPLLGTAVSVNLPIFVELASGSATVTAIPCRADGTMVTLTTASQAASARFGSIASDTDFANFGTNPVVQPASAAVKLTILTIPIAVGVSGTFPLAAGAPTAQNFTKSDIDNGIVHSASGNGGLLSGLAGQIHFDSPGGLGGVITALLNPILDLLRPLLVGIIAPLDGTVDTLLRTLGLRLGTIDTVVHGARCGTPTLVT
ncbi:MAG TPA: pilus assembly protein TadG-related protein [Micropepsaceae bacterium]|jgi:uncharacterized membrane protein